jgi:hypothetical protein
MAVAQLSDRTKWKAAGLRFGIRKSGLSQKAVSAILSGVPVKVSTLATFRTAMEDLNQQK